MEHSICPTTISQLPAGTLLLDVREKFEYNTYRSSIEGLENMPFSEFDQALPSLDKSRAIVLFCNNGLRSQTAARFMRERGFENVRYVRGGLVKWQQNGLEMLGSPPDVISHSMSLDKDCSS